MGARAYVYKVPVAIERWHDREHKCVEIKLNWGLALTVKMKYQRICNRKE